jgi:molybdopterin converting factor small subunit
VEVELPRQGCTIAELRGLLAREHPEAGELLGSLALRPCVDDRLVGEEHRVADAASVEFFPPLSGG